LAILASWISLPQKPISHFIESLSSPIQVGMRVVHRHPNPSILGDTSKRHNLPKAHFNAEATRHT